MRFVAGLGRRSGRDTAGRGAVAERHREDVAGRGAATRGDVVASVSAVARGGAVAEILLPGRAIGKKMLAGGGERRGEAAGRQPQEGITTKKRE